MTPSRTLPRVLALLLLMLAPAAPRAQRPASASSALAAPAPDPAPLLASFRWRNLGPANMGGRIVDIEAEERDFATVYLGTGTGGLWKSANAGITWTPIFDRYPTASIGDVAIFQPDPRVVWVGTGEANNRNSVSWGDGVYKSTDGGQSFTNVGLRATHQIARVVTHPSSADTVFVCAIGHLWGYSGDRGLFMTGDGGRSWTKLAGGLPNDGRTGCTDLVMDSRDSRVLYAAFYHRLRRPWTFQSGGPAGGIFKSTDGGRSWRKLTAGLPAGETGRIGLAVYRRSPNVLMAIVEAKATGDLSVPGSGIYRSEDGGESWRYVNTYNNRPFYYSQIRINPTDSSRVYVLTTRFMVSEDGGRTLRNGSEDQEIHGDFHAMWVDPSDGDRYYIGSDKGAALTHDHGRAFGFFDNIAIGQYYRIGVDMRDPYHVYGGLQDNGSFAGPSFSRDVRGVLNDDNWKMHWGDGQDVQVDPTDWRRVYTEAENGSFRRLDPLTRRAEPNAPNARNVVNYDAVVGRGRAPDSVFRFNWSAPLVMSPHDPRVLYLGGNHLFRTADRGHSWTIVSPDLSTGDPEKIVRGRSGGITPDNTGAETHGTITSVSESPVAPGVIWAVTDDGNVQLTRDGGRTWTNTRGAVRGVPPGIWAGRVEASHVDAAAAYVVFDGHRSDLFTPWVFKTTDYGRTWTSIAGNLPDGWPVHVVREDRRNPNLLFAGTEQGVYATLDGGRVWTRLGNNMPTVPVQDLLIHPRDNDLIAGTHGRSIYILDDITPLQQLNPQLLAADGHLFEQRPATLWENVSRGGQRGHMWFAGENPPSIVPTGGLPRGNFRNSALIAYYLRPGAGGAATIEISDLAGRRTRRDTLAARGGVNRYQWDLRFDPPPLTEEQRALASQRMAQALQDTAAAAAGRRAMTAAQRQRVQRAYDRFQSARTDAERRQALRAAFGGGGGSGGESGEEEAAPTSARRDPALAELLAPAPQVGPGTYLVRLTVGGNSYTSTLTVRADPLLSGIE